jgi:hypothetical protein
MVFNGIATALGGLTGELWSAGTSRHLRYGLHSHLARFDTELEALVYARI